MIEMRQDRSLKPGTWKRTKKFEGTEVSAMVSCSNGHVACLWDHEIDSEGVVMPSLVCPEDGCDFHERVKLVNWRGTKE
ncbi:MAG: hypothetical protein FVQ79_02300 [Planctomycetes bacterium]|nr:hypothetical protein [Planctomycetota bacterium]